MSIYIIWYYQVFLRRWWSSSMKIVSTGTRRQMGLVTSEVVRGASSKNSDSHWWHTMSPGLIAMFLLCFCWLFILDITVSIFQCIALNISAITSGLISIGHTTWKLYIPVVAKWKIVCNGSPQNRTSSPAQNNFRGKVRSTWNPVDDGSWTGARHSTRITSGQASAPLLRSLP